MYNEENSYNYNILQRIKVLFVKMVTHGWGAVDNSEHYSVVCY